MLIAKPTLANSVSLTSCSFPVGVRLLRKLGWKEGQGIGPRVKKKVKKKEARQGEITFSVVPQCLC